MEKLDIVTISISMIGLVISVVQKDVTGICLWTLIFFQDIEMLRLRKEIDKRKEHEDFLRATLDVVKEVNAEMEEEIREKQKERMGIN